METKTEKRYLLVIRRNKNDYLPLEWQLTSNYEGENLESLEGIDNFTRKQSCPDLLTDILDKGMVNPDTPYRGFAIIYFEKGKTREVKEGTIFNDETPYIDDFLLFILENINDKTILSEIYNICNINEEDKALNIFKYILKNINIFLAKSPNGAIAALSYFKSIPYELKRKILFRFIKKYPNYSRKEEDKTAYKHQMLLDKIA